MKLHRIILVSAAILLNIPAILSSETLARETVNFDLAQQSYSGCHCNDCMNHYLTWSRPFWQPQPDGCGTGMMSIRARRDARNSSLFLVSLACAAGALVKIRKRVRPGFCICGYDLKGLSSNGPCPECGALPSSTQDRPALS